MGQGRLKDAGMRFGDGVWGGLGVLHGDPCTPGNGPAEGGVLSHFPAGTWGESPRKDRRCRRGPVSILGSPAPHCGLWGWWLPRERSPGGSCVGSAPGM